MFRFPTNSFCEGAKIVQQKNILHGYQSHIKVTNDKSIFKKI